MIKKLSFPILGPKKVFSTSSKKAILFLSKKAYRDRKESIGNKVIDSKVDRFHRIYIGFNIRDLLNFETNRIAVFTKNPDGTYSLSSRKAINFST